MKLLDSMFQVLSHEENRYHIRFCADHVIYQAHFPGKPITPGVCIVKILGELLELQLQNDLTLKMIKNLKFVKPISPIDDEEVEVVFQKVEYIDDEIRVKGIIQRDQDVYTKFSLRFDKA